MTLPINVDPIINVDNVAIVTNAANVVTYTSLHDSSLVHHNEHLKRVMK
jgi:hypothetical protein